MVHCKHAVAVLVFTASLGISSIATAVPVVFANGVHTIDLQTQGEGVTPMNVTYDPVLGLYYSGRGGNEQGPLYVWNGAGSQLQSFTPTGIDLRSLNYNPNTGDIEAVVFAANTGNGFSGTDGLVRMNRDGAGLFQNPNAQILASMPGLPGDQTMPAYDPDANVFYAREQSGAVNIVNRADGALLGTVNLDLAAAGNPTLTDYVLGFDSFFDVFVTLDPGTGTAHVFELDGDYVGGSSLAGLGAAPDAYGLGYANGQVFVYDSVDNRWEGFAILGPNAVPVPGTLLLLLGGLALLGGVRRRCR